MCKRYQKSSKSSADKQLILCYYCSRPHVSLPCKWRVMLCKGAFDWADLEQDCSEQHRSIGLIWFSSAWCMHQLLRLRRSSSRSSLTFCQTLPSDLSFEFVLLVRASNVTAPLVWFAICCNDSSPAAWDLRDIKQIEQIMVERVRLVHVCSTRTDCSLLFRISPIERTLNESRTKPRAESNLRTNVISHEWLLFTIASQGYSWWHRMTIWGKKPHFYFSLMAIQYQLPQILTRESKKSCFYTIPWFIRGKCTPEMPLWLKPFRIAIAHNGMSS